MSAGADSASAGAARLSCAHTLGPRRNAPGRRPHARSSTELIHEGRLSIARITAQMRSQHDDGVVVYGHVLAEGDGGPRVSAEEAIPWLALVMTCPFCVR